MRIVYLDEAGISKKEVEPLVIVAGVIVHGDHQLTKLRDALDAVMRTHIPEHDRKTLALHTCDIYGGNKYFDKRRKPEWTWDKRAALLDDLARLPAKLNLRVTWAEVAKEGLPYDDLRADSPGTTDLQFLVGLAYVTCLVDVDQWFREKAKGENCFVVVEDNNETRRFVKAMHQKHQDHSIAEMISDDARELFPLRHIKEDPNFQEKRAAHPLVLADFIAYMWKRVRMKDERAKRFAEPWIRQLARLDLG